MKKLILGMIFSIILASCASSGGFNPEIVPKCPKVKLPDGSYACKYTLEEVKQIYKAGAELKILREEYSSLKKKQWIYLSALATSLVTIIVLGFKHE